MPINFSGLASGLDTGAIIDSLVSIERSRADVFTAQKQQAEQNISTIGQLSSLLSDLSTKLNDFSESNKIRQMAVESSNEERITVSSDGAATPGNFALRVTNLARAQTSQSNTYATTDAGVVGTGTLDLTVGSDESVAIAYDANDSLFDIAERITNSEARATASVLFDGSDYRIMVTSEDSGLANAITFAETGDSLGFMLPGSELLAADDARFSMNGVAITRPTNSVSDVVNGVTLNLLAPTPGGEADTMVQISQDGAATSEKIQEFVDSYNSVTDMVNSELSYNGVEREPGSLFGDSTIRSLQRAMSTQISSAFTNGAETTSLGALGIAVDTQGKLSLDSSKLNETLASDPRAIDNLFAGSGGNDGFTKVLQDLVETYTQSGTGLLSTKTTSFTSRIKVFDQQIERVESRASSVAEQLNRQFTALEETMSRLNSQQSFLGALGL